MDWNALQYVLAVARAGTLAAAGRALRVDPTTVGRRIVAIEAELGARLFDRLPDGFRLTEAGEVAAARAETMEAEALSLASRIAGSDTRVAGAVRLTALDGLLDHLLIPTLPRLLARHPELELTLISGFDIVRLSRLEADIALRTRRPSEPDAVARPIGTFALAAYCARDREFGADPPVIGLPVERETIDFARFHRKHFPGSRVVVRANAEGHTLGAIRAGLGVGFLDCFIGDADPALRRFLPEPVDTSPLLAISHVDMHRAPRLRAVTDFLIGLCEEAADLIEGRRPQPAP